MPKRTDIKKILLLGSGLIVIVGILWLWLAWQANLMWHSVFSQKISFKFSNYEKFRNSELGKKLGQNLELPSDVKNIDYFESSAIDTHYLFIKAFVDNRNVDIQKITNSCKPYPETDKVFRKKNVTYNLDAFKNTFIGGEVPRWFNRNMDKFIENYLVAWDDAKEYGYGCWTFYDPDQGELRHLRWGQQYLGVERLKASLHLSE